MFSDKDKDRLNQAFAGILERVKDGSMTVGQVEEFYRMSKGGLHLIFEAFDEPMALGTDIPSIPVVMTQSDFSTGN